MATLQQLREGVSEFWDTLMEGWQSLYRRAYGALTHFRPGRAGGRNAGGTLATRGVGWAMLPAEVVDQGDRVLVRLEAPGMDLADLDIEVTDNYLVVRGEKQTEQERTEGNYFVSECAYGSFERAIPLPDEIAPDQARARYRNGVLRVELPKPAAHRRKTVEVKAG